MNINVLEGIRCPKCGNEESFCISVKTMAIVCDDGVSELYGDNAWDDDSYIECHCGHSGTVGNFRHDRTHWGECFTCSWGDQTTDNPVKCLSCNHGDMWQGSCLFCKHGGDNNAHGCDDCLNLVKEKFHFSPERWAELEEANAKRPSN